MKFSWQILNYFLNLQKIPLNKFEESLTLAGLEIDTIEDKREISDRIIDLNITANRRDIYSITHLATEISAIFNIPLKIKHKKFLIYKEQKHNYIIQLSNNILYYKLNIIHNIINNKSPQWLQNHLLAYNIKSQHILKDIQEYIKIKWGQKILIINELDETYLRNIFKKNDNQNSQFQDMNNINSSIIICFPIYNYQLECNIQNYTNDFFYAYEETIRLITTFTKGTISKSKEFFNKQLIQKIKLVKIDKIKINKKVIQKTLGPLNKKSLKFLSKQQIFVTLNQLNLKPLYVNKDKTFIIKIPKSRIHDLKRKIDIIEEIGRIYGFKYFLNKLPPTNKKGNITKKSYNIYKITHILRNIGFNEVINSSLNKPINHLSDHINLYNPINEEQKKLRNNIIEGLIENYKYNIKQKSSKITIFEIGKIFYKNNSQQYIEETHLGGLIYNQNFIRTTWTEKIKKLNWFHAKGIIELFFEKLKINIGWKTLNIKQVNDNLIIHFKDLMHPIKQIAICNPLNNEYIGILSEVNKKHLYNLSTDNRPIYFFEINIEKLNNFILRNQHLTYMAKPYSLYPSVIRDINIEINKYKNINYIENQFIENKEYFIESIKIISEYNNKISKKRSICLRIIYRSNNRTLNSEDINHIDKNINKYLFNINKE